MECKICSGDFKTSPDSLIVCKHKGGNVHKGCCTHHCSGDQKPCEHSCGEYERKE